MKSINQFLNKKLSFDLELTTELIRDNRPCLYMLVEFVDGGTLGMLNINRFYSTSWCDDGTF